MNEQLTDKEKDKIQNMCFNNPDKSCAIVQEYVNTLQLISCPTFADLKGKSKRTIYYQAAKLKGVTIEGKRYLRVVQ